MSDPGVHFWGELLSSPQLVGYASGLGHHGHHNHFVFLGHFVRLVAQEGTVLVEVLVLEHPSPDVLVGNLAFQLHEQLDHLKRSMINIRKNMDFKEINLKYVNQNSKMFRNFN